MRLNTFQNVGDQYQKMRLIAFELPFLVGLARQNK